MKQSIIDPLHKLSGRRTIIFTTFAGAARFSQGSVFHGGWIGDLAMCVRSGAHGAEHGGASGQIFNGRSTQRGSMRGVGWITGRGS